MNRLTVSRQIFPALLALSMLPPVSAANAAGPATKRKSQLEFGVDMAKRGLWSEALFRFEQARSLEPGGIGVLNNLAVCYEAAGRFEEALETYREALKIDPANRALKQNYSRFAEFYQSYRPKPGTVATPSVLPVLPGDPAPGGSAPGAAPDGTAPSGEPAPLEPPPPVGAGS